MMKKKKKIEIKLNKNKCVRKELYKVMKWKISLKCGYFTYNGASSRGF